MGFTKGLEAGDKREDLKVTSRYLSCLLFIKKKEEGGKKEDEEEEEKLYSILF